MGMEVTAVMEIRLVQDGEDGTCLQIKVPSEADLESRFEAHGFGLFLKDVKDGEIAITEEARLALLSCRYRDGLAPMEFFRQRIFGCCTGLAPVKEVSVHDGALDWINGFSPLAA